MPRFPPLARLLSRPLRVWKSELEEDGVPPDAFQLRDPLAMADDPEAEPLVKSKTRAISRKDAGLDRPDPCALRVVEQGAHECLADPCASCAFSDVHAVLGDSGVTPPLRRGGERGPADDDSVKLANESELSGVARLLELGPGRSRTFEGRLAGRDPFLPDRPYRRPVRRVQATDRQARFHANTYTFDAMDLLTPRERAA
jgi:hypothetical protein